VATEGRPSFRCSAEEWPDSCASIGYSGLCCDVITHCDSSRKRNTVKVFTPRNAISIQRRKQSVGATSGPPAGARRNFGSSLIDTTQIVILDPRVRRENLPRGKTTSRDSRKRNQIICGGRRTAGLRMGARHACMIPPIYRPSPRGVLLISTHERPKSGGCSLTRSPTCDHTSPGGVSQRTIPPTTRWRQSNCTCRVSSDPTTATTSPPRNLRPRRVSVSPFTDTMPS
jgi:hypothetical protein